MKQAHPHAVGRGDSNARDYEIVDIAEVAGLRRRNVLLLASQGTSTKRIAQLLEMSEGMVTEIIEGAA